MASASLFICGTASVMVLVGPEPGSILVFVSSAIAGSAMAAARTVAIDKVRILLISKEMSVGMTICARGRAAA
jgi:hypothetical protein